MPACGSSRVEKRFAVGHISVGAIEALLFAKSAECDSLGKMRGTASLPGSHPYGQRWFDRDSEPAPLILEWIMP